MAMTVEEATEMIAEISRVIDEDVSDSARDRGIDFFEDVLDSAGQVEDTIMENGYVTASQESAIRNWLKAVSKWVH